MSKKKKIRKKQRKKVNRSLKKSENSSSALVPTSSTKALSPDDPVARYMMEVRKYPLLTAEEEYELAVKYRETKDKVAAERLVTSNLRFVIKIASEYSKFGTRLIDLIQEGNVGLMHAVREFNPYKGVRLITYAVWWIRGYIREYLLKQYSMVKIGTTQAQKKLFYNLEKEQRKLDALGEENGVALISQRLGVAEKDVKLMQMRMSSSDMSLDQPLGHNSSSSFIDLQSGETVSPEEYIISQEDTERLKAHIDEILPKLNEKETYILQNRLLTDEPKTLQEIGDRYSITRERTRQLEARVIKKLKEKFLSNE